MLAPILVIALACQTALLWLGAQAMAGAQTWPLLLVIGQVTAIAATAVLLWRVLLVARYRPASSVSDAELPTVTVLVPAYNEGAQVRGSLVSLVCSDYPREKLQIIAIDDGSRDDTWTWMKRAAAQLGDVIELVHCPVNRGKRHALYEGFVRARGDVVVTVDSDSEVLSDTLRNLVSPLVVDPRVGAVAGNVRVLNRDAGSIARMLEVSFNHAFEFMRASESEVAAVMCCPGALSAYRRVLIDQFREQWITQTFLGAPAAIGEDRAMTNHVLRRGHHVRFQANAIVLTEVPTTTAQLARMLLRWARSNVRESLVMAGFAFRRFRAGGQAGPRVNLSLSLLAMVAGTLAFIPTLLVIVLAPTSIVWMLGAALIAAALPAAVFTITRSHRGAQWAFAYALYSVVCLSWITPFALISAHRSGWLTRQRPKSPTPEVGPTQPSTALS
ncbi:Poly-beta-1,6-N-acetyl-D-glucosamine synthase [Enhygromyxa salina]|uniref:Poly-beta-1,6-N-acetyl-D-glucosamine synthase n=2 Tax=Enhygromyxa salina TaxID=215803 RepID=A0A2S9YKJ9_9BACT|nr:Poly-beta-1,6-N-acetyl-D-glucosamine synthase [Enhygromyxa salina]